MSVWNNPTAEADKRRKEAMSAFYAGNKRRADREDLKLENEALAQSNKNATDIKTTGMTVQGSLDVRKMTNENELARQSLANAGQLAYGRQSEEGASARAGLAEAGADRRLGLTEAGADRRLGLTNDQRTKEQVIGVGKDMLFAGATGDQASQAMGVKGNDLNLTGLEMPQKPEKPLAPHFIPGIPGVGNAPGTPDRYFDPNTKSVHALGETVNPPGGGKDLSVFDSEAQPALTETYTAVQKQGGGTAYTNSFRPQEPTAAPAPAAQQQLPVSTQAQDPVSARARVSLSTPPEAPRVRSVQPAPAPQQPQPATTTSSFGRPVAQGATNFSYNPAPTPQALSPAQQQLAAMDEENRQARQGLVDVRGIKEVNEAGKAVVGVMNAPQDAVFGAARKVLSTLSDDAQSNTQLYTLRQKYKSGRIDKDEYEKEYQRLTGGQ